MANLDDAVSGLTNLTNYVGQIIQIIRTSFPQITGTATTATGGGATLPANPVGYITMTLPNGTAVRVPYYT